MEEDQSEIRKQFAQLMGSSAYASKSAIDIVLMNNPSLARDQTPKKLSDYFSNVPSKKQEKQCVSAETELMNQQTNKNKKKKRKLGDVQTSEPISSVVSAVKKRRKTAKTIKQNLNMNKK